MSKDIKDFLILAIVFVLIAIAYDFIRIWWIAKNNLAPCII